MGPTSLLCCRVEISFSFLIDVCIAGLLPSQRVPRTVRAGAVRQIMEATNAAPPCGINATSTHTIVPYVYITNLSAWSERKGSGKSVSLPFFDQVLQMSDNSFQKKSSLCGTCFKKGIQWMSTGCRSPSSVNLNQCNVSVGQQATSSHQEFGERGTAAHYINETTAVAWYAVATNGRRWLLNRTTTTAIAYSVCPPKNGTN